MKRLEKWKRQRLSYKKRQKNKQTKRFRVRESRETGVCGEREKERLFCLFGFLTSSSTTRLYCGRAPRQSV